MRLLFEVYTGLLTCRVAIVLEDGHFWFGFLRGWLLCEILCIVAILVFRKALILLSLCKSGVAAVQENLHSSHVLPINLLLWDRDEAGISDCRVSSKEGMK